ncbi:MAG: VWA domain-containing protein [Pseudomonadota bacterium]
MTAATLCCLAATSAALAQDRPNTILVMDGSGSMWGQIEGVAKITIAQDVVQNLLADFPADQGLGLTVYGHRERGECTDIETVVAPAPGTAAQIADAVSGIQPLGKTPMTDAVIAAAEALRYTEDKATVILVSDGVETCNPDPCAAARLMEEAGIDFTAHVIGFDVGSDAEALAQMQCIADETGGQFLTADTADQLTQALTKVAVAEPEPEPEPVLVPVTLTAVIEEVATLVEGPVLWDIEGADGLAADDASGNPLALDLVEGSYVATAYSTSLETALSRQFVAIGSATSVEIAFPAPVETARLIAPAEAPVSSMVEIGWDGPAAEGDFIGIGAVDATGGQQWRNHADISDGNPLRLQMPPTPGPHVIRYFKGDGYEAIGEVEIAVTPVEVTLATVETAIAGSELTVEWSGPDYPGDFIGVGETGATGSSRWENYTYTAEGSPLTLTVPVETGTYEITYFLDQDHTPVTSVALTVTEAQAAVIAPSEATAGSTIEVGWNGPGYDGDFIGIGKAGATGSARWDNYAGVESGNPVDLTVPATPGDYVITYFARQDYTPLAEAALTVTEVGASITAPAEAVAGATIEVGWTGPDYNGDFIAIGKAGATGAARWENYAETDTGTPVSLTVPPNPGDYVITYFARQDYTPLAEAALTVTEVGASITAPAEGVAGATIEVGWTGPDYNGDFIAIGKAGATGAARWENYTGTDTGNPVSLTIPPEPGDYAITYFARQDYTPLAEVTLTATVPTTSVAAPAEAIGGSTIEVEWSGPDYDGDYIGIGPVGASGAKQWANWVATSEGSPASLLVPPDAGEYAITYFARQDRTPLASTTIAVVPPTASIVAPPEAVAGSTIEIEWTGPNYRDDYIGIGPADGSGAKRWINWVASKDGSPAQLIVPPEPGPHLITYYARQNRTPLFELPIDVLPATARLIAPQRAAAGSSVQIGWDGPNYAGDYIGIGKEGETGSRQWSAWRATESGNPVTIDLPDEPGAYVVRYFMRQGRLAIAEAPMIIE